MPKTYGRSIIAHIKLLRPHHYLKNILVFLPLFFAENFRRSAQNLERAVFGFIVLCLLAYFVYIINDLRDCEKDRLHPKKKSRPIAAGEVAPRIALPMGIFLALIALFNQLAALGFGAAALCPILYVALNLCYTFWLKTVPIIDVSILAAGYLLRIIYGAEITGTIISPWLYFAAVAAALFIGLGKRRNECLRQKPAGETRGVLKHYSYAFLDKNMYVCLTLFIVFYSLWSIDAGTMARLGSDKLFLTVPVVLLIMMRYSLDIEKNDDDDPVEIVLHDKWLLLFCVLFAFMFLFISANYFA
jgi:4-hydroxybenzoate polyprenyltransferase